MYSPATNIIRDAIRATKALIPEYWDKTLASRQPGSPLGSRFLETVTEETLLGLQWTDATDEVAPEVRMEGCTYFTTQELGGVMGVVPLAELQPLDVVRLDDSKGTGAVSAVIPREACLASVDFTTLIVGPEQGEQVVFTLHPGPAIRASQVPAEGNHGRSVTVAEALSLGLEFAKIED